MRDKADDAIFQTGISMIPGTEERSYSLIQPEWRSHMTIQERREVQNLIPLCSKSKSECTDMCFKSWIERRH